jgi:hypothetical protein
MQQIHDGHSHEIPECNDIEARQHDPQAQLRSVYMLLLTDQARFDEFKHLLSLYPPEAAASEPAEAAATRAHLNERFGAWLGAPFSGLSATQMLLWRAIVVDERFNIALSPWREANNY